MAAQAPNHAQRAAQNAAALNLLEAVVNQARRDSRSVDQARAAAAAHWLRCELAAWAGSMGLDIPPGAIPGSSEPTQTQRKKNR